MKTPDLKASGSGSSTAPADPIATLLEHARRDGFTTSETERLWSNLGAVLGLPANAGGGGAPAGAASTAGGLLGTKTLAILLVGGGVVVAGGGFMAVSGLSRAVHHAAPAGASVPVAAAPARNPGSLSAIDTSAGEEVVVGNVPTVNVAPGPIPPGLIERAPQAKASRPESPWHPSPAALRSPEMAAAQSLSSRSSDHGGRIVEERDYAAAPGNRPPAGAPPNEGALLLRAQQVLASDPSTALDLTRQHARLFPAGGLVPEREVLAIEALVQLGRLEDARSRFGVFRARFPQSPHLARLEGLLRR
jgi:hypothetical protein